MAEVSALTVTEAATAEVTQEAVTTLEGRTTAAAAAVAAAAAAAAAAAEATVSTDTAIGPRRDMSSSAVISTWVHAKTMQTIASSLPEPERTITVLL